MERQSEKQPDKNSFVVKVYLVLLPINLPQSNMSANRKIIAAKLTWSAAKHIQDQIPGSEIERIFADKSVVDVHGNFEELISQLKGETNHGTKSNK